LLSLALFFVSFVILFLSAQSDAEEGFLTTGVVFGPEVEKTLTPVGAEAPSELLSSSTDFRREGCLGHPVELLAPTLLVVATSALETPPMSSFDIVVLRT
jgi:hypothetical protein